MLERFEKSKTYIYFGSNLQICSTVEEIIKNRENTLAFKNALQAGKEAQYELELAPISRIGSGLGLLRSSGEYLFGDVLRFVIGIEDDGGDEGDLERLLDDELDGNVQQVAADLVIFKVGGNVIAYADDIVSRGLRLRGRDQLPLVSYFRDGLTYIFPEHKKFSAESRSDRLFITASLRTTIIAIIIF